MSKVIFELEDGTKKEFDGEKFTDEQVNTFNEGWCAGINCMDCPLDTICNGRGSCIGDYHVDDIVKCYRVTEEPKPIQILRRLIDGGSVWIGNNEVFASDIDLFLKRENGRTNINSDLITLEKPKKKIKVERWINVCSGGNIGTYKSKELADMDAGENRIACEHFIKEYEI